MKIIDLKKNKETETLPFSTCLLLGNFDGVHKGHTELVKIALDMGKSLGLKVGVWTFADHPMDTLSGRRNAYLSSVEDKNHIFAALGIDYMIYEDFSRIRDYSPERFVEEILKKGANCRAAVCGYNFRFGKNGEGTPSMLVELLERDGGKVAVVDEVRVRNTVVCSTAIRSLIEDGKTEEAIELLGRPYSLSLPVEYGKQLGRTLGLPTINQRFPVGRVRPKNGIYACVCDIDGRAFYGVANVGSRPTVNGEKDDVNCETHIIDYDGWLYGKKVRIAFYGRLRDEKRFDCIEELKKAIENDVSAARDYFSKKGI